MSGMNKKIKILIILLLVIVGSGLLIFFEYQYGFVIPDSLPEESVNNVDDFKAGDQIYHANLSTENDIENWEMEGPGEVAFENDWMEMKSPNEEGHHVFWCPEEFPDSFIATWNAQNLETDAGLVIVFFAAQGKNGKNVLDPSLPERDGTFTQYTRGAIRSYHISYYANAAHNPGREQANLRKNPGFNHVQKGRNAIPIESTEIHKITLVKNGPQIAFFVDNREVINWYDTGLIDNPAYEEGQIGFRQMKWTHFRYSDFTVRDLDSAENVEKKQAAPFPIPSIPLVILGEILIVLLAIFIYRKL